MAAEVWSASGAQLAFAGDEGVGMGTTAEQALCLSSSSPHPPAGSSAADTADTSRLLMVHISDKNSRTSRWCQLLASHQVLTKHAATECAENDRCAAGFNLNLRRAGMCQKR